MVHFMSTWLNCTVPRCLGKCYPSCVCDSVLDKVNIWSDRLRKAESESEVAQLCPTLSDTMDCSLLGSSVHGILQASVLEWGAIAFSRRSCRPRDRTQVSCIVGRRFTMWATREVWEKQTAHSNAGELVRSVEDQWEQKGCPSAEQEGTPPTWLPWTGTSVLFCFPDFELELKALALSGSWTCRHSPEPYNQLS